MRHAVILALLQLSNLQITATTTTRRPLVVSVSGGGFVSMTAGMALARAMTNISGVDMLPRISHLGGNSGGSYFGTLFMYSEQFHRNVRDSRLPLEEIVNQFMKDHVQALADLSTGKTKEFGPRDLLHPENGCPILNPLITSSIKSIEAAAQFPYWKNLPYVAASILKNSIDDINTATYATKNQTLPQATLVQVVALPPDAWTSYDKSYGRTLRVKLQGKMLNGTVLNFFEGKGRSLPMSFTSAGMNDHSWAWNSDIVELSVVPQCPFEGPSSHKPLLPVNTCKKPPFDPPATIQLSLPKHPLLAEVTAASGAAPGFAGSPTVYLHAANAANTILPDLGIFSALPRELLKQIQGCMPFGLESMGPPMISGTTSVAESESGGKVVYRYLDGGYAEDTSLPMTLAKAQRDCREAKSLDCSGIEPISLILVNDGDHTSLTTGFGQMTAKDPLRALFWDETRPVGSWVPGMWNLTDVPSQTIFAEDFPSEEKWIQYNQIESTRVLKLGKKISLKHVPRNITSYLWTGVLTTVDNKYYGVLGGQKVRLLIFSLDIPGVIWPGLLNDRTEFDTPGEAQLAFGRAPGWLLDGHGRMAAAQSESMLPHLVKFFAHSLDSDPMFV